MKKKILFMMSGSIAAFKACQLLSKLVQNNFEVKVVASPSALKFVGPATLEGLSGHRVHSDLWAEGTAMDHIHLVRWADLVIVVPASASLINRLAHGLGDDLLSTLFLAHKFDKPFLLAPAMNTAMYLHPATQASLSKLKAMGLTVLESASGVLACGEEGLGRLLEPELLYAEVLQYSSNLSASSSAQQMTTQPKILITSGGTTEPIDQIRSITNKSTGSTGSTLAQTLCQLGYDVTLLKAKNSLPAPAAQKTLEFETFKELQQQLSTELQAHHYEAVIHAAAVSDFSVQNVDATVGKISSQDDLVLHLKRNPKLVDDIKKISLNKSIKLIAFKLTVGANEVEIAKAVQKLQNSASPDLIVHNDLKNINQEQHDFHVYRFSQNKIAVEPTLATSKTELAQQIAHYFSESLM